MMFTDLVRKNIQGYFAATQSDTIVENMVQYFTEDAIAYDPVGTSPHLGHSGLHEFFHSITQLFSKLILKDEFISINGHEAAVKWKGHGVGKNGQEVHFEGIDLFEFNEDGKIKSLRSYWNPAPMLDVLQSRP